MCLQVTLIGNDSRRSLLSVSCSLSVSPPVVTLSPPEELVLRLCSDLIRAIFIYVGFFMWSVFLHIYVFLIVYLLHPEEGANSNLFSQIEDNAAWLRIKMTVSSFKIPTNPSFMWHLTQRLVLCCLNWIDWKGRVNKVYFHDRKTGEFIYFIYWCSMPIKQRVIQKNKPGKTRQQSFSYKPQRCSKKSAAEGDLW